MSTPEGSTPGGTAPGTAPGAEPGEADPQVGENTCPDCAGTGRTGSDACATCGGAGTVQELVGDA